MLIITYVPQERLSRPGNLSLCLTFLLPTIEKNIINNKKQYCLLPELDLSTSKSLLFENIIDLVGQNKVYVSTREI